MSCDTYELKKMQSRVKDSCDRVSLLIKYLSSYVASSWHQTIVAPVSQLCRHRCMPTAATRSACRPQAPPYSPVKESKTSQLILTTLGYTMLKVCLIELLSVSSLFLIHCVM